MTSTVASVCQQGGVFLVDANYDEDDLAALSEDVRRRQWRVRGPQPMANAINNLLARHGYAQVQTTAACGEAWAKAAGQELARASRAGLVRRGTLEVTVQNSIVLQELTFRSDELLRTLMSLVPDQKIRKLRFRVGTLP